MSPVFAALPFILCVVAGLKVLRRLLVLGFPASDCNSYVVSGFKWLRQLLVRRLPALHLVRSGAPDYVTTLACWCCDPVHLVCRCAPKCVTPYAGAMFPCISFVLARLQVLRRVLVLRVPGTLGKLCA